MTEHHGLDLDGLFKANGGHSIFAPSGSYMWLLCSGSLIPNLMAQDDAGIDAAYGTVGHEVGEEWLLRIDDQRDGLANIPVELIDECRPSYLVGRIVQVKQRSDTFDILIDDDMLAYVRQYIVWCAQLPGSHYIETRNDFSELTPLPKQGGTADHAACDWQVLTITDLKMGKGEQVFAAMDLSDPRALIFDAGLEGDLNGNPQALIYAAAFFLKWDWLYDFQRIVIRIAQPRIDHFQTWETTREELLKFMEHVKIRSAAAWVKDAPRTPSKKGCRWCKVKGSCAARAAWMKELRLSESDDVFDPVVIDDDGVIEGQFTVKTYDSKAMAAVNTDLVENGFDPDAPNPGELSTAALAKLLPHRKLIEDWFKQVDAELLKRSINEHVPGYKRVTGREGNRIWIDEKVAAEELEFVGISGTARYNITLLSPAQATEYLRTKYRLTSEVAAGLIAHLVTRSAGKPTLVPLTDKREAIPDVGSVFDDVSVPDEDTI